jgi:hypothetical protein
MTFKSFLLISLGYSMGAIGCRIYDYYQGLIPMTKVYSCIGAELMFWSMLGAALLIWLVVKGLWTGWIIYTNSREFIKSELRKRQDSL